MAQNPRIDPIILKRIANPIATIIATNNQKLQPNPRATILLTFALVTATGDLVAEKFALGYGWSFWLFVVIITAIGLAIRFKLVGSILGFWATYILTRPLGASIGDYLSQDKKAGGIGLGTTNTSFIFLAVILAVVAFLTVTKKDRL